MRDTGLWANSRAVAYLYMVDDTYLPGQSHVSADAGAAGDARLRRNHGIFADRDIVSDLHQVVDFRAASDNRLTQGRPVDGRVRPNLDVVFNFNNPDLGNFNPEVAFSSITKSVATHHDTGMKDHPVTDPAALPDDNIGMKHAIFSNLAACGQNDSRVQRSSIANFCPVANKNVGKDSNSLPNNCARLDIGKRAHPLVQQRGGMKKLKDARKSEIRVGCFQISLTRPRGRIVGNSRAYNDRACRACGEKVLVAGICQESNRSRSCFVNRRDFVDNDLTIADNCPVHVIGEFGKRFRYRGHYFFDRLL